MQERKTWLFWDPHIEGENRKAPKIFRARTKTFSPARWRDKSAWMTFADASQIALDHGVGLMTVIDGDGLCVMDIDGEKHSAQTPATLLSEMYWESHMMQVARYLESYTETSTSGKGVHIFGWGTLPFKGANERPYELYSENRLLIVTGHHIAWSPQEALTFDPERLRKLSELYFPNKLADIRGVGEAGAVSASQVREVLVKNADQPAATQEELLEVLLKLSDRQRKTMIRLCLEGDWQGARGEEQRFPSQSEADLHVMMILARLTGGDAARMDALFKATALLRLKYIEPSGNYRDRTIRKALQITQKKSA